MLLVRYPRGLIVAVGQNCLFHAGRRKYILEYLQGGGKMAIEVGGITKGRTRNLNKGNDQKLGSDRGNTGVETFMA